MPTHQEIYERHAPEYEALVSREDYEGNIMKFLRRIAAPEGKDIVDLGAGTGRLAGMLAPAAGSVMAFDLSAHMLSVTKEKLQKTAPRKRWVVAAADHRHVPLRDRSADLIVSGWSVSYVATWHAASWRSELDAWLDESCRVLRPGGMIVLFESLGTGNESPLQLPHLENFYGWLSETGFANSWIRTDYRFESPELADQLAGFFFGDEMKGKIRKSPAITLPECTGVWWRSCPGVQVTQARP